MAIFVLMFSGPNEPILIPKIGCDVDLEVELCVVIGKDGKHIPKGNFQIRDKLGIYRSVGTPCTVVIPSNLDKAMEHVFGFTAANDVSGRDWQMKRNGGQWLLGKAGIPTVRRTSLVQVRIGHSLATEGNPDKAFDTFLPLGPYIETDLDYNNLNVRWVKKVEILTVTSVITSTVF